MAAGEREDDPRVHIPAAVARRIAASKVAFATQGDNPLPADDAEPPTRPDPPPAAAAPPTATASEEEPPPSNDPVVSQGEDDGQTDGYAKLLQTHRSLQGKYNTETANLRGTLLRQSKQIEELTAQITRLSAQIITQPVSEKKDLTPPRKHARPLTPEEVEHVGEDLVDVIDRKAYEVAEQLLEARLRELGIADLAPKVQNLTGSVEQLGLSAEEQRKARFRSWMDTNVAGWQEQDVDPLFLSWLQDVDQLSGIVRGEILRAAMRSENYNRVKMIFQGYATEQAVLAQSTRGRTRKDPPELRTRLETIAAPNGGRGRTDAIVPSDTPEAPLTGEQIRAYYRRRALKPNSLSEAEVAAMERRISAVLGANSGATGH